MIYSTNGFLETLPRTPVTAHIGQVHAILMHLYGNAGSPGEQFMEAAQHSLRQIAVASLSMLTPEERYTEEMRRRGYQPTPPPAGLSESMVESVRAAFKDMAGALQRMRRPVISPEAREINAAREYRAMLRAQRTEARVHLQREVTRVRRELGLNETGAGQ